MTDSLDRAERACVEEILRLKAEYELLAAPHIKHLGHLRALRRTGAFFHQDGMEMIDIGKIIKMTRL